MAILVTTRSGKGSPLTQSEMDANLTNLARSATESAEGNVEIADSTETASLADLTKVVVPGYLQAGVDAAITAAGYILPSAAGCFNGLSGATAWKRESGFDTVVRNSEGDYTLTFDDAQADGNYTVLVTTGPGQSYSDVTATVDSKTTLSFTVQVRSDTGGGSTIDDDCDDINVVVFR